MTVGGGSLQQMSKFAACMRGNGEPSFPDPNAQGVISAGSLDRGSPQFEQALQACRKDLPNSTTSPAQQAQDLRQEVAFAARMHRNGVPNYPDPLPGTVGQVLRILPNSGLDPQSPLFQKARQTCQKKVPGSGKG